MANPDADMSPVWRPGIFKNKVVFCTGGAGSICSAQVRALVRLGADACIIGRNAARTEAAAAEMRALRGGARVLGIGGVDVRRYGDLERAVARCVDELGGLDFVIAGAAGNFLASLGQLSSNAFRTVVEIDLVGSFNTLRAALPHLRASAARHRSDGKSACPTGTGGRIIFVSATLHYAGSPMQLHAAAAKAGVDAVSAAVCIEEGPRGLTSNVIAPGAIAETEGMSRLAPSGAGEGPAGACAWKSVPAGRAGYPREIADATVFLFSEAGNYVNGAVVVVDGGGWRTKVQPGAHIEYPDFLLADGEVTGVKGTKKAKI